MSWIRLDDHTPEHPKLIKVGPVAAWLWICGLAWCSRHLTDGELPHEALSLFGIPNVRAEARRLVVVGLWQTTKKGYRIHDYLKYQPSAEQVTKRRADTAQRVANWKVTHGKVGSNVVTERVVTALPEESNAITNAPPVPVPDPVPDPVGKIKSVGVADAPPPPRPDDLARLWNDTTTPPIPRCLVPLSAVRQRLAKARLGEGTFQGWRAVFARIEQSAFCRGTNDRGWVASFDWILRPDTAAKVLEGKYDDRGAPPDAHVVRKVGEMRRYQDAQRAAGR